jgi:transposase
MMRWDHAREEDGIEALRRTLNIGRSERLSAAQRQDLVRLLKEGTLSARFPTELWTLPRIAQLIEAKFEVAWKARLERTAARWPGAGTRRAGDANVESQEVARTKKNCCATRSNNRLHRRVGCTRKTLSR